MPNPIKTENLTKSYGALTAVKDLSIDVFEGEVFGLLGPNGAGKTTSISMMCGLLKPDKGRVWIQGELLTGGKDQVKTRVGVCPQEIVLWERLTCREQLQLIGEMYGMPGRQARLRANQLLEELDLAEKSKKQARTLSGGMKRRLNLAMALVHDPQIVVLDEPEAGLDPQSRVKVREYIQSLARSGSRTVILTTHNMDEAERLANRVGIIDHGDLLVLDTPEALKRRVGEGDVVEIQLKTPLPERDQESLKQAQPGSQVMINSDGRLLTIRALDAVASLPIYLESLDKVGADPGEVRVRENTLEDVFIQLTGRRLRE
ncbi:MAG: ABC transporter ATP-binding protein [Anaerolineales bacterium]|nr:ABC transporter ATP-binding protein [Anaerolineales bacterium]